VRGGGTEGDRWERGKDRWSEREGRREGHVRQRLVYLTGHTSTQHAMTTRRQHDAHRQRDGTRERYRDGTLTRTHQHRTWRWCRTQTPALLLSPPCLPSSRLDTNQYVPPLPSQLARPPHELFCSSPLLRDFPQISRLDGKAAAQPAQNARALSTEHSCHVA
jgi:hypothetical protein